MDTVVAKILNGSDENGYMYKHITIRPDVCPICKNRIEDVPNLSYKVKKKHLDFIVTYDHYTIVSQKFKDFCDVNKYQGLEFIPLLKSEGFYCFKANNVFELDYERRKTKFIKYNDCCGSFDETIGATPAHLKNGNSIISNDFIYRSEYRFASYAGKDYLTIIGLNTMKRMKQAKFKGLYYDNVFQ